MGEVKVGVDLDSWIDTKFPGSPEEAFEAHERRVLGKLESERRRLLPLKELSQEFKEWLVGFWEGDGFVLQNGIGFCQKDPRVLEYTSETAGTGYLRKVASKHGGMWSLTFKKAQAASLLFILTEIIVSERRLKQLREAFSDISWPPQTFLPTKEWFTGFWDAEGHSNASDGKFNLGVSQKEPELLEKIRNLWNLGRVYGGQWIVRKAEAREVGKFLLEKSKNPGRREKLAKEMDLTLKFEEFEKSSRVM